MIKIKILSSNQFQSKEEMAEARKIHEEMQLQYLAADCRREHLALYSKSFANHLKIVTISCCARNSPKIMSGDDICFL